MEGEDAICLQEEQFMYIHRFKSDNSKNQNVDRPFSEKVGMILVSYETLKERASTFWIEN